MGFDTSSLVISVGHALSNEHLIYFSKAQSTSKLMIFLDSKLERANSRVTELDSKFTRIENRVSRRVLRLASDCQLTFELDCILEDTNTLKVLTKCIRY